MPGKLHGEKEYNRMLEKYGEVVAHQLKQAFTASAIQLAGYSRSIAPVSPTTSQRGGFTQSTPSGRLRQSITHEVSVHGGRYVGAWGTNLPEAIFPEFGTEPHDITPRNKTKLRFWTGPNEVAFARRVRHPGVQVGTPESPKTSWKRKTTFGGMGSESMPYIRPSWSVHGRDVMKRIKEAGGWK